MTDTWASRLAKMDEAIDKHFAEQLRIIPHAPAAGNYSVAQADPNRPEFEVQGRLHIGRHQGDLGGESTRMWGSKLLLGKTYAEITASRLPSGFEFRKDDRLEATECGMNFVVETVDRHEQGLVYLILSRASA